MHGKYICIKKDKCKQTKEENVMMKRTCQRTTYGNYPFFKMLRRDSILTPVVNWDLDSQPLKCVSQIDYHDDISGAGIKLQRNQRKDKNDYKYLPMKVFPMKRDLFKTDVFCLFVCFNSYKGRSKPPWLRMTDAVKRNDKIEMERTFKSFIKVWTFRN